MFERRVKRGTFGQYEQSPPSPHYITPAVDLAEIASAALDRINEKRDGALRVLREALNRGDISGREERQMAEEINRLHDEAYLAAELQLAVRLDELKRIDEDYQAGRYEQ